MKIETVRLCLAQAVMCAMSPTGHEYAAQEGRSPGRFNFTPAIGAAVNAAALKGQAIGEERNQSSGLICSSVTTRSMFSVLLLMR
jgi:hypothetical protein